MGTNKRTFPSICRRYFDNVVGIISSKKMKMIATLFLVGLAAALSSVSVGALPTLSPDTIVEEKVVVNGKDQGCSGFKDGTFCSIKTYGYDDETNSQWATVRSGTCCSGQCEQSSCRIYTHHSPRYILHTIIKLLPQARTSTRVEETWCQEALSKMLQSEVAVLFIMVIGL